MTVGPQPGEDPKERVDRELNELLGELRVVLPGIELLFGFLLILPFSDRFESLVHAERVVYLGCLIATATASALFIAPSVQHRRGFRTVDKEQLLMRTNRQIVFGLVLVALAISLAVYLAVGVVLDATWAGAFGAAVALWFFTFWFVIAPPSNRR